MANWSVASNKKITKSLQHSIALKKCYILWLLHIIIHIMHIIVMYKIVPVILGYTFRICIA